MLRECRRFQRFPRICTDYFARWCLFHCSFCLDGWQYAWHRYFHTNRFLYRHVHSVHHRLYVPYAFGALYNHPVEGFVLDTLGAVVAQTCARMTIRQSILFFIISTAKTVDDHGGYNFKWDPFQLLFANDVDYHDIHRERDRAGGKAVTDAHSLTGPDQTAGLKKNFSRECFRKWRALGPLLT